MGSMGCHDVKTVIRLFPSQARFEPYFIVIPFRDTQTYLFPFVEITSMTKSEFEIEEEFLGDHYILALRHYNRKIQDLRSSSSR